MVDLILEYAKVDFKKITTLEEGIKIAKKHHIKVEPFHKLGHIIESFFDAYVEENLIQPTLVTTYPIEISPLTKKDEKNPNFTQRFEFFINKTEYANAYTELNEPVDQRQRLEEQIKEKELGSDESSDLDTDFLEALEYGMPPCGGIGIGIDRLVMLLTDTLSIRDILLFPHSKKI
jgi:lysyl-tRNA synthetase class 2